MGWGDALTAIGAAGEGALDAYSWQQEYKQRDRQINQRGEIAQLQAEVRAMLESMKEGGRNQRHADPSGSVVAQQEGANTRAAAGNETRTAIAEMNADVQRHNESGRNTRFEKGLTARDMWNRTMDSTRRRGQDLTHDAAGMRDETTRRGQDFGLGVAGARDATTRRGQDLGAATTRRGQDIRGAGGTGSTGLPPLDGPEVVAGEDPAAAPAPDPGRAALAGQIRAALVAVQNAKTPAARAAALEALRALRAKVP